MTDDDVYRRLWSEALWLAYHDLGSSRHRRSALDFFNDPWALTVADLAGLDRNLILAIQQIANTVKIRRRFPHYGGRRFPKRQLPPG